MYRWIRSRAGVFSSVRYPIRINSKLRRGEIQHVQSIRFKKPPLFRPKQFFVGFAATIVVAGVFRAMVISPLDQLNDELDELDKNMDDATRKALEAAAEEDGPKEEDSKGLFLPFPFTVKMINPKPYSGNDPEWKEYVKFSKNIELSRSIRNDLVEIVRVSCTKHPQLAASFGKTMKVRRSWLDIDFPAAPPPSYVRSGLEITDDYIAWSTMPVDYLTVARVQQALWPTAIFQSIWAFINVLSSQNLTRVGTVLGREQKPQPTFEALVALHKTRSSTTPANPSNPGISTVAATQNPDSSITPKQPNIISGSISPPPTKKTQSIEKESEEPVFIGVEVVKPSFTQIQEHMKLARIAFKQRFAAVWSPPLDQPPRGSIVVSGLIELESPRGWIVLEVLSFWDPKTRTYDTRNTRLILKRHQRKKQSPRS